MIKLRTVTAIMFGIVGAAVGTTMGLAGSFLGLFFGAVAGTAVFAGIGAVIGWFAARDIQDGLDIIETKQPRFWNRTRKVLAIFAKSLYLDFGFIILSISKIAGLLKR